MPRVAGVRPIRSRGSNETAVSTDKAQVGILGGFAAWGLHESEMRIRRETELSMLHVLNRYSDGSTQLRHWTLGQPTCSVVMKLLRFTAFAFNFSRIVPIVLMQECEGYGKMPRR